MMFSLSKSVGFFAFLLLLDIVAAERGDVVKYEVQMTLSTPKDVDDLVNLYLPSSCPPAINGLKAYRVTYETIDVNGLVVNATGLVVVPLVDAGKKVDVVSYGHGAQTEKNQVPSSVNTIDTVLLFGFFGGQQYCVTAPDYVGQGVTTYPFHPYLHANTEASATADLLIAAANFQATVDMKLSGNLFTCGYSQGAQASMAFQYLIEYEYSIPFKLIAASDMSGPYDISNVTWTSFFSGPSNSSVVYAGYLLFSMNATYNLYTSYSGVVKSAYVGKINELYDGYHNASAIKAVLPAYPVDLFEASFVSAVDTDDSNSFKVALKKQDVYKFKPKHQLKMWYGGADIDVNPDNALNTVVYMRDLTPKGGDITATSVGADYNHETAALPCFNRTYLFFEGLPRSSSAVVVSISMLISLVLLLLVV